MRLSELLRIPPAEWTDEMIQATKMAEADNVFSANMGETEDEKLVARLMRKGFVLGIGEVLDLLKLIKG
mgnify:FL=1